jgi:hypothetical protein
MAKRKYDRAKVIDAICESIADGQSLLEICKSDDMPSRSTVCLWLAEDATLSDNYARACEMRADAIFEEILEIADDASNDWMARNDNGEVQLDSEHVQRSRLRIDARKWVLARMAPAKYGDRLSVDANVNATVTDDRSPDEIKQSILGKLAAMSAARGSGEVS